MKGTGPQVTVVGGGIAGLVAAIRCAQQGSQVQLLEASGKLGGRARSADAPYVANYGPHALYGTAPSTSGYAKRDSCPASHGQTSQPSRYVSTAKCDAYRAR
jgi:phytoene dehydrogenase-like protein